jgi:CheY-like chemotaxis protein
MHVWQDRPLKSRILVLEDDRETAAQLVVSLSNSGYQVDLAVDGDDGLRRGRSREYVVMTIDRILPGLDGLIVLQRLREDGIVTPALILSALGGIDYRVHGLRAGGDDYLVKPFAFAELLARVEALARRSETAAKETVLRVGDLTLDVVSRESDEKGHVFDGSLRASVGHTGAGTEGIRESGGENGTRGRSTAIRANSRAILMAACRSGADYRNGNGEASAASKSDCSSVDVAKSTNPNQRIPKSTNPNQTRGSPRMSRSGQAVGGDGHAERSTNVAAVAIGTSTPTTEHITKPVKRACLSPSSLDSRSPALLLPRSPVISKGRLSMANPRYWTDAYRRTLLTFLTIPLILVGIPYGLLATGQPLSFFGTLGIISLRASSSITPSQPMAVLMMSGLAVASLLTLLFVPAGYFVLFRFDRATVGVSDPHHKPVVERLAS